MFFFKYIQSALDFLELIVDFPVNTGTLEKHVDLLAIVRRDRPAINLSDVFLQVITRKKWRYCCSDDYFRFCFEAVLQPTLTPKNHWSCYNCYRWLIFGKMSRLLTQCYTQSRVIPETFHLRNQSREVSV